LTTLRDFLASLKGGLHGTHALQYSASYKYQFARLRIDARQAERRQVHIATLEHSLTQHFKYPVNFQGMAHHFSRFKVETKRQIHSLVDMAERIHRICSLINAEIIDPLEVSLSVAKVPVGRPVDAHALQKMHDTFNEKKKSYASIIKVLWSLQRGQMKHSAIASFKAFTLTSDQKLEREVMLLAERGYREMKESEWRLMEFSRLIRANKLVDARAEFDRLITIMDSLFKTISILSKHKHDLLDHNFELLNGLEETLLQGDIVRRHPEAGPGLQKEIQRGLSGLKGDFQKDMNVLFVQADELERESA